MINRRSFIAGACCILHGLPAAAADLRRRRFFCGTPNVDHPDYGAPIVTPSGYTIYMVGASIKPEAIWKFDQGATPNTGKITLNVKFMDGRGAGSAAERRMVRRYAQDWTHNTPLGKAFAFNFDPKAEVSHVRVGLHWTAGDNSSLVGTEAIAPTVKPDAPTMKIDDVHPAVIRHEFGHVLGLRHEHQNPYAKIPWDRDAIYNELGGPPYNWSRPYIDENLLDVYKGSACPGQKSWDPHSIMMYQIWPEFLDPNVPISRNLYRELTQGNTLISRRDRECVERIYGVRA